MSRAGIIGVAAAAAAALSLVAPAAAPARGHSYAYDVPVLAGSPWPEMRRDSRNTAESPIRGRYRSGDKPWAFKTGRGIFSTPVIGDDGTVYVGSADGNFYALGKDGKQALALQDGRDHRRGRRARQAPRQGRLVPDHDRLGRRDALPAARRQPQALAQAADPLALSHRPHAGDGPARQLVGGQRRLRARAATCSSATRAAAPTRSTPGGKRRWVDQRGNSVWTTPAFDAQGNSYWGSVDLFAFSLDPDGHERWQTPFAGYVTSSPALGSDGTVYVGAFDGKLHALDPDTGAERWSFPTAPTSTARPRSPATRRQHHRIYIGVGRRHGLRGAPATAA